MKRYPNPTPPPDRENYSYPSWPDKDRLEATFSLNATDRVLLSTVMSYVRLCHWNQCYEHLLACAVHS